MKKLAKYGLIPVALGLVLGTALLFPAVLLKGIIEPIAAVLWAAWRVVTSVQQGVYWGALIVGYVILIIRFLPRENSDPASPAYRHRNEPRTQVERWQALLKGTGVGADESVNLRESLMNLVASTIGQERKGGTTYENGAIRVPDGNGLGVSLDRAKLAQYHELYRELGGYPYDRDPGRPGWYPTIPNRDWADPNLSLSPNLK